MQPLPPALNLRVVRAVSERGRFTRWVNILGDVSRGLFKRFAGGQARQKLGQEFVHNC